MMRRKLDLSTLTEEEAEHVLQVVQRDMRLRKTEEERLSDLKQELDEEDSRCVLLSRQQGFNQRCCIRCCSPFTFLLKPRRRCLDCNYNICKRCCSYSSTEKGWLCSACEKSRLLKTQSLEWFYSNVRRRFKRFGSAKVLKTLYRRHIAEQGRDLAELTEESTYDESLGNDDSMYESDTTFYKHSEEHSMAETISVALRVAEEAIDEAIAKAETYTDNKEKQNEASYLRDNRGELIEELTTTIVQKIIRRKKEESETQPESNVDWPPDQKTDVNFPSSPTNRPRSAMACQSSPKVSIWRSRSAVSLLTDEKRHQNDKAQQRPVLCKDCTQGLKKDGVSAPTLPSWKSVDRMDTSILQSPDGNWIALQSTQLSRPSLLTKRKSLVFSVLEKESGVVSAYDGMGSDTEPDADGTLGAAVLEIRQKLSTSNVPFDLQSSSPEPNLKSSTQTAASQPQTNSDQDTPAPKFHKSPFPFLKRKVPLEYKRPYSQRLSVLDVNFNPEGTESSEDGLEDSRVKRTRRRRRTKREDADVKGFSALSSAEPDYSRILLDVVVKHRNKRQGASDFLSDNTMDTTTSDMQSSEVGTPDACVSELENNHLLFGSGENQLTSTLRELSNKDSQTQFSSIEDELDRVEEIVGERNDDVDKERESERGEALWDMEVDMKKEESVSEMEDCGEQKANENLLDVAEKKQNRAESVKEGDMFEAAVEEGKVGSKKENSGKLTTDIKGDNKQRTAENQQEECSELRLKSMVAGEHIRLADINNTNTEGRITTTKDTAGYRERIKEAEEGGSQEKHDKTELTQIKKCTTTEEEIPKEPERQRKAVGQRNNESKNQEDDEQTKDMEKTTTNTGGDASLDDARSGIIDETDETEQDSCSNQAITGCQSEESEVEYERMTDSAIKPLDNTQKDTEAQDSKMRISRSDDTERSESEEEIVRGKKNEMEIIKSGEREEYIEVEQDRENKSLNEQTQESFVEDEDESKHDLVEKTEEPNCVGRAEECDCKEHILKEDLNSAHYGQEVYLTPEEIYKGTRNLDLEKDLQFLSTLVQQKYTAASLRSITTEVLKVLNATEDLIQGAMNDGESRSRNLPVLPPAQSKRLDEQLSRLEENVYVAASAVFGLEVELDDLEECARSISAATSDGELTHLEEQVATVAAHVQQSDLQVTDIAARIAALKNAGLNVAAQTRFARPQTLDSSRQHRRRLPAPPMQDKKA
ncbi:rab effector MyRIP isoform X1 [Astyanax mexicanus]|uniref:rab effector MyRIP isoform X1 n=1 Tax=Astyanax mexicanus TaxID=7994 RepID=UPI0020CB2327|nr:rab effector MyRIP isoform X1 [Astyanax mexicanus]XP_022533748.2 rab effector MyRIP isoform X1 [Astyanax mexicanus]XP_049338482.1 rab effector MyRIP isoform X1 [Astyanax mexicanus]